MRPRGVKELTQGHLAKKGQNSELRSFWTNLFPQLDSQLLEGKDIKNIGPIQIECQALSQCNKGEQKCGSGFLSERDSH